MYINSPKFQQSWWHSRLIKSDHVVYSLHVNVAQVHIMVVMVVILARNVTSKAHTSKPV